MKYFMYFLIAGAILTGLVAATSKTTKPSEGIYPGELFPSIDSLKDDKGAIINLTDLKGQRLLVNFWASYDANSRKENVLMSHVIDIENYPVTMVSVSFDKSEKVFGKTVVTDGTGNSVQCWADENLQSELTKLYRLEKGFKSYLIDEDGKIVAMDVNAGNLNQYLKRI